VIFLFLNCGGLGNSLKKLALNRIVEINKLDVIIFAPLLSLE
jgi:hypothetical protein